MTDEKATEVYNKLNFLFSIMIPLLDLAEETTKPMREVKFHLKRLRESAGKEYKIFYDCYENAGFVDQEDGKQIHSLDIWKISEQSYETLFELIFNKPPHELVSFIEVYKAVIKQGIDINKINFQYKPIKFKEDEKNR